tara:strand:+ start:87 stop:515 length:429 start_codon:yes stop_codon:yes gene_type:complete
MKKVLIVNANYYEDVSSRLVLSAKNLLKKNKIQYKTISVPGIFEIPYTLRKFINKFDAFIALGCVIKGETPHFDLISRSTFEAIVKISVDFNKPITNGIITCLNKNQAIQRSSVAKNSKKNNKGLEAASAVIALIKNEPKNL